MGQQPLVQHNKVSWSLLPESKLFFGLIGNLTLSD